MVILKRGKGFDWNKPLTPVLIGIICFFFTTGCSVFGIRTSEEARYHVLAEYDQIEIREYEALVVVETDVVGSYNEAGNIAFKKLFGYISGENGSQSKIAMTALVMSREGNAFDGEKIAMTSPVIGVKWIRSNGLERLSTPRSAGYDPPWTIPFLRRNEIMIDIK